MQSPGQPTPLDVVKLYIRHTSNEGDAEWIPRLCANPVRRHDPDSVTEMTHAEQMERISGSSMRALGPQFHTVVLHGEGPFVTWIWYGGVMIGIGGLLALIGRVAGDLKRRAVRSRGSARREAA